jgi:two-component system, LytTR family, sensor kinase
VFSLKYRYLFIFLLTVYSYFNILFTVGENLLAKEFSGVFLFLALALVVFFLWELNRLAEWKLGQLRNKIVAKIHLLILFFIVSMAIVVIACAGSLLILDFILGLPIVLDYQHTKLLLAFGFRVNLFLHCLNAIVFFMNKLKKAQLEAEQLKKISVEAQFEALSNQINPHFMFNCFNVLSTLVYKDPDISAKFISQISNVYRYLLHSQERKLVSLKDELTFVESYLFLLQIRYGQNLIVQKDIEPTYPDEFYVAPASLQMLIENAIKHNIISKSHPLKIHLYSTHGAIVVSNNLQEKQVKEQSTKRGLLNIQNRYRLMTDEVVKIEKTLSEFKVEIPLLQIALT